MVGSLRSWLEKSRNEPRRLRSPTHWRRPAPPTVASWPLPHGSRRRNAPSWPPWLLLRPLLQLRAVPRSVPVVLPRPQQHRPPASARLAGRVRRRPPRHPPSAQSAGRGSLQHRLLQPSDRSGGPGSQPPHLPHPRSVRSDGRGRVRALGRQRRCAEPAAAGRWVVRRSPDPNPDPPGQVSTGFG
jgi:hypothetical protein